MIFAPYNDLDINLEELEKNNEIQKCLSDRPKVEVTDRKKLGKKHKIYNIKCNKIEEDAIEDATAAAERFLKSQKDLHRKLLEVTVDDALSALSLYKDYLKDDPKKETYKIHMLVPVQVLQMLKENELIDFDANPTASALEEFITSGLSKPRGSS